jgi:excisionase family DNA binding protein
MTSLAVANERELVTLPVCPANDDQPAVTNDTVLDVEQTACLLRVGRNTIYELVGRNEIPHRRLGKQIRFSRDALMSWLGGGHGGTRRKGNEDARTTRS